MQYVAACTHDGACTHDDGAATHDDGATFQAMYTTMVANSSMAIVHDISDRGVWCITIADCEPRLPLELQVCAVHLHWVGQSCSTWLC